MGAENGDSSIGGSSLAANASSARSRMNSKLGVLQSLRKKKDLVEKKDVAFLYLMRIDGDGGGRPDSGRLPKGTPQRDY